MSSPPPSFPDLDADSGDSLDRIIGLNDGIFAFSMTLLAVNVDLPSLTPGLDAAQVTVQVMDLLPQFLVFATTFLLVALYWQVNRRTFRYIVRYDSRLIWINIFQLLFIAFLPVASGLFDSYAYVPIVIVVYGGTLIAIGVLGQLLWLHVSGPAKLVDPALSPILIQYYSFRAYVTIFIYVALVLVGVFSPEYARWVLLVLLLVYPFLNRIYRAWWLRRHSPDHV